jgi:hypothetical protein
VALICAREALGKELEVKWHTPDHIPMWSVAELLGRSGNSRSWVSRPGLLARQPTPLPVRYLPLLQTGRRFGTEAEPTGSETSFYVVLSPTKVVGLRDEREAVLQAGRALAQMVSLGRRGVAIRALAKGYRQRAMGTALELHFLVVVGEDM